MGGGRRGGGGGGWRRQLCHATPIGLITNTSDPICLTRPSGYQRAPPLLAYQSKSSSFTEATKTNSQPTIGPPVFPQYRLFPTKYPFWGVPFHSLFALAASRHAALALTGGARTAFMQMSIDLHTAPMRGFVVTRRGVKRELRREGRLIDAQ